MDKKKHKLLPSFPVFMIMLLSAVLCGIAAGTIVSHAQKGSLENLRETAAQDSAPHREEPGIPDEEVQLEELPAEPENQSAGSVLEADLQPQRFTGQLLGAELFAECPQQGTLEYRSYQATDVASGKTVTKNMIVYLPYLYDPALRYDVVILCHGGGGDESYWFTPTKCENGVKGNTKNLLDNMIWLGLTKPVIAVSVSWRNDVTCGNGSFDVPQLVRDSDQQGPEMRDDILPFVAENYATWANGSDSAAIAAARDHFAYVGLSWGSMTGILGVMQYDLEQIAWYGLLAQGGFSAKPAIQNVNSKWQDAPVRAMINVCGTKDKSMASAQAVYNQILGGCKNMVEGKNAWFFTIEEGGHAYGVWEAGLYNCLQIFFR